MTTGRFRAGNTARLIENGEFFSAVFAAIGEARREVLVETFIIEYDAIGRGLQRALIAAAQRGVHVELTMDGFGSAELPARYINAMTKAGVHVRVFDPKKRFLGWRTNLWRRLHRKLVVIDGVRAFVGGINFARDHMDQNSPQMKQDYAVEVTGPVVQDIHRSARSLSGPELPAPQPTGDVRALFVMRDNERHHNDIEVQYQLAFRNAKSRIIIANAYFFPGFRLLRELYAAAARGVLVELITQGNPDQPAVRAATKMLYDEMCRAGIVIHEYRQRPLHAKVAVVDDDWCTVGSSNLDPLSLFLNIEANVVFHDRAFTDVLAQRLRTLIERHCTPVRATRHRGRSMWRRVMTALAYHAARRFPRWAGYLPGRRHSIAVAIKHGHPPPEPWGESSVK